MAVLRVLQVLRVPEVPLEEVCTRAGGVRDHALDGLSRTRYNLGMKLLTRLLTRYWGYLALAIAILGFLFHGLSWAIILILSLASVGYFLLAAPVWCCAVTRTGELCRDNSKGLLLGCHRRQHRWQRLRETFTPAGGRALMAAGKSVQGFLSMVGGVAGGITALISAGVILFH